MKHTTLEVKSDGQIFVKDGDRSILCADQEQAKEQIAIILKEKEHVRCHTNVGSKEHPIYAVPRAEYTEVKPGIYSIPDVEWEKEERWKHGENSYMPITVEVAILKESPACDYREGCGTVDCTCEKESPIPDYINPNPKKVSEVDLKAVLKEVNEKNREFRESFRLTKDKMDFTAGNKEESPKEESQEESSPVIGETNLTLIQLVTRIKQRAYLDTDEQIGEWIKEYAAQLKPKSVVGERSVEEKGMDLDAEEIDVLVVYHQRRIKELLFPSPPK